MQTESSPHTTEPNTNSRTIVPSRNTVGLIALLAAIVGTIFACIPGALIVGWILLPIAFILSLVSLFQRGKKRGTGVAALIVSIVGTIIGVIVFFAAVAGAVDDAFNQETTGTVPSTSDTESETVESDTSDEAAEEDSSTDNEAAGDTEEQGTRASPYPIGTEISSGDWAVTVNSVDLDATEAIMNENPFNDEPDAGNAYILVNITTEYIGSEAEGSTPWAQVAYVSEGGNTFETTDSMVVAPESFDRSSTLYENASESGNIAIQVPSEDIENGALSLDPGMFSDKVFVAVS